MALKSTVWKVALSVSDLDRSHFAQYALTVAQHPSETPDRVMVRLLAFALHASEDLRFGKGIASDDEPAVWEVDPAGVIRLWIELGLPDESRLRKACGRADRVVLLAYGGRAVDLWCEQNAAVVARLSNLRILEISPADVSKLGALAARNLSLDWTIQEGVVYLGEESVEVRAR